MEVSPFVEASGNTPPTIRFEDGASVQGARPISTTLSTAMGNQLTLALWVSDDAKTILGMQAPKTPPVILPWSKFRGPGVVTFANARPAVDAEEKTAGEETSAPAYSGHATTTATFSEPGEYVLRVVGQRLVWKRRSRISVLLDECSGKGFRKAVSDEESSRICSSGRSCGFSE